MNKEQLKEEVRLWSKSAIEWIDSLIKERKQIIVQINGSSHWIKAKNNQMIQDNTSYFYDGYVYKNIIQLPAYLRLINAMKKNDVINSQLDKLVMTATGGATRDSLNLAISLIPPAIFFLGKEKFDFEEQYKKIIEPFFKKEVTRYTIAPILGLDIESEIELDSNTKLRFMTDDELSKALNAGLSAPHLKFEGNFFIPNDGKMTCLEIKTLLKKYVGDLSKEEEQELSNELQNILDQENEKLDKFRQIMLLQDYDIDYSGIYTYAEGSIGGGITYRFNQTGRFLKPKNKFNSIDTLKKYWNIVIKPFFESLKGLSLSLRRLGYSVERTRLEDKLLDLLIAAEAFYMSGEHEERIDIGYKLRLRAAFWYEGKEKRKEIMDYFKIAYGLRSTIAHGGTLDKTVKISKEQITIEKFIKIVEEIIIQAIKKRFKEPSLSKKFINWDEIIIGDK